MLNKVKLTIEMFKKEIQKTKATELCYIYPNYSR